jgi:hypothetical protein
LNSVFPPPPPPQDHVSVLRKEILNCVVMCTTIFSDLV